MSSPFPGMDPYLEQADTWHDFHESLCHECRRLLVPQLGERYIAKLDEHVYVHELPVEERRLIGRGDVTVSGSIEHTRPLTGGTVVAAPIEVELLSSVDFEREHFIEIRDRQARRLVTVIELLSPANKQPGRDRSRFLGKRDQLLSSEANYVEIDLLRGGPRMPVEDLPECDFYALVSRAGRRPKADLWPVRLSERLPTIPIPLWTPDPDASLDLQEAFQRAFESGGYRGYIYAGMPDPPLTAAQQAWVDELLPKTGRQQ